MNYCKNCNTKFRGTNGLIYNEITERYSCPKCKGIYFRETKRKKRS